MKLFWRYTSLKCVYLWGNLYIAVESIICADEINTDVYVSTKTSMASRLENIVKTSIVFLLTIVLCYATIRSVTTHFIERKRVASSHTTLKISEIQCVRKCSKERQNGMCTIAGYNKATQTCFLSVDDPLDVLDTTDEMAGVFFYDRNLAGNYIFIV